MPDSFSNTENSTWNIALVEGKDHDYQITESYLNEMGIKRLTRYTSAEDLLKDHDILRSYSCILLAYQLPGMDGLACLRKICELKKSPPVMMLTSSVDLSIIVESMKIGAKDHISKETITPKGLYRALQNAIERHQLDRQLKKKYKEAEHFASIVSHDLKSPIRVISLISEMLENELDSENFDRKICQSYCSDLRHSAVFVKNLLTGLTGYLQQGTSADNFSDVNLNEIIKRIKVVCQGHSTSRVCFEISDMPEVWGDKVGLSQVFHNLISNAIKYNKSKTPNVSIHVKEFDDSYMFCVTDNGIGIAPEHHKKIFQPLQRLHAKDEYEGTGIGLALVKKIMDQHKGTIKIISKIGEGSRFCITLPKKEKRTSEKSSSA